MRDNTPTTDQTFTRSDLIPAVARRRAADDPHAVPFEQFRGEGWRPVTMAEYVRQVDRTAAGLIAAGVEPGDRVALMAETRLDWVVVDMAVWTVGAVTVPVYPSSSADQLTHILADSGARVLIAEGDAHREVIGSTDLPADLQSPLYIDDGGLDELADRGSEIGPEAIEAALETVEVEAPASIVYTSGTTGAPKGCVLTHANLLAEAHGLLAHPIGVVAERGKKTLMFLPLAHVFARAVTYTAFIGGATVGFWDDTSSILPRLGDFRPNMILGVPRVFEKVRDGIATRAASSGPLQKAIFARAEQIAVRDSEMRGDGPDDAQRPSLLHTLQHKLFDLAVYRSVREALGGRAEYAISGGGALPDRVAHFFRGLGVPIYEGYGLTETTAAATVNGPGAHRIGTVGFPVGDVRVRVAESGEVEMSGSVVFTRYWNNEEATAEALNDGWFATGDLGFVDDDGYLSITGRKKELIVTAGGKNVSPGPIEDTIRSHPLVGQAVLIGEGRKFVSALIAVDEAELENWAQSNDRAGTPAETLVADPDLRAEIQKAVDAANRQVSHAEGVKKFTVLPRDFTEASGELTATMKVKRHVVSERFAEEIEDIYR